jgi:hypothetical protein
MRVIAAMGAALALALAFPAGGQSRQPSIVGTWEWTRKSNGCSERYVFRDDGSASVTSRDERLDGRFRLAWSPEENGRYRLDMAVAKDHGGRNCLDDDQDSTGRSDTWYVLFSQSRETMILCGSLEGRDCLGPLRRAAP